ncbi:MAG TPA: aquaporin [Anaerolineales bacterium]|nr:aquaporin [Anaerolineales bacterium]
MANIKVFVVEFIGTFALVLIGGAAGIYSESMLAIALAHGLTLAVFVYAFGYISGAHINPAVTLGLAANGNIKWGDAAVYWLAQFSGAALAAFALWGLFNPLQADLINSAATNGVLITRQLPYQAMAVEAVLTFFLVNTVLHTAVGGKAGPFAGWAIGTTLMISIMAGGPLTGASLNPARSFGPAIFTSAITAGTPDYQNYLLYLVYFIGPFLGSILAVSVYQFLSSEPASEEEDEEEEVEESEEEDVEMDEAVIDEEVEQPAK